MMYIAFRLLLGAFAVLFYSTSAVRERLSRFLAFPARQTYGPTESAIVIVGGDDDIGRHLALDFSEQGYTVFALCPDGSPAVSAQQDASNVSSLIQEWHQRIKKSGHSTSPWGLVAPIVLDMTSDAQRTRAFETVDAYCTTHSLHLVAVIVLPARKFITSKPGGTGLNISAWGEVVRECLVTPISVVQDYTAMLATARGRVVLLLASAQESWTSSLRKGIFLSAAQYVRQELEEMGISTSTVVIGPSAPVGNSPELDRSEAGNAATFSSVKRGGSILSLRNTIEDVLPQFAVRHEDVWLVLQDIVRSRYPRNNYDVGLHATLQAVFWSLPTPLRLGLKFIRPYFSL